MLSNLALASKKEQSDLVNSIDHVFFDIDGTIKSFGGALPGAIETINTLKQIGKKVAYVTNNSMWNTEVILSLLREINLAPSLKEVVHPIPVIIQYLKSLDINKALYVIGTPDFKEALELAGFTVAEDPPEKYESLHEFIDVVSTDNLNIGVVICDYDKYVSRAKLQRALTYLRRPDCLFIVCALHESSDLGSKGKLIANYHFVKLLSDISGREPIEIAKPAMSMVDYLNDRFNITNPERVLFVGDSIPQDMAFATNGGYKKLLMLSGVTKLEDVENWIHPEELKPHYYLENMNDLLKILKNYK